MRRFLTTCVGLAALTLPATATAQEDVGAPNSRDFSADVVREAPAPRFDRPLETRAELPRPPSPEVQDRRGGGDRDGRVGRGGRGEGEGRRDRGGDGNGDRRDRGGDGGRGGGWNRGGGGTGGGWTPPSPPPPVVQQPGPAEGGGWNREDRRRDRNGDGNRWNRGGQDGGRDRGRDGDRDRDRGRDRNGGGWNGGNWNGGQDRGGWERDRGGNWDRGRDRRRDYDGFRNRWNQDQWRRDWSRSRGYDWWRRDRGFRGYTGFRSGFYFAPNYGYYAVPRNYWGQRWYVGDYLPSIFWRYRLNDWRTFGLGFPPPGTQWVAVDNHIYLIDSVDGYIIEVIFDAWRW